LPSRGHLPPDTGKQQTQRIRSLLGDDTVPEGSETGVAESGGRHAGRGGDAGDVAGGEAHHPFDEGGVKASSIVNWPGCWPSDDGFPAVDGGSVSAPLDAGESSDGLTAAPGLGDWLVPYGVAHGVDRSGSTTCDSGGRNPSLARLPGVPVSLALGVGSRAATSAARFRPCLPAICDGERLLCRFSCADAPGVGSRDTACRRFIPPWVAWPMPVPSLVVGVGSRLTAFGNCPSCPCPFQSRAVGVGGPGEEEPAFTLVGGADVGRSDTRPLRIEPEFGKRSEDDVKSRSPTNDGPHVFQDDEAGS
jgi:hypothetical protein